jgi:tRNA G18 (ribose-2'-O)-methylase SpoU
MKHAKTINLPIVFTHKDKMSRMVRQQPHQNIILKCSQLKPVPWQTQTPFADGIYVYCDKITDPQNFGAILRSCLFFGVTTIFTGKKHHCPLN